MLYSVGQPGSIWNNNDLRSHRDHYYFVLYDRLATIINSGLYVRRAVVK